MPTKSVNVKNKKQDEALKDTGMSKERVAKIANSPRASKPGGEKSHSGSGKKNQGGTTAEHKAADRKGGTGREEALTCAPRCEYHGPMWSIDRGIELFRTQPSVSNG